MVVSKKRLTMSNLKILFAFVFGWFVCGLLTPYFLGPSPEFPSEDSILHKSSNKNGTKCDPDEGVEASIIEMNNTKFPLINPEVAVEQTEIQKTSSRCEFIWDSSSRCRRPPMKPFDVSRRANLTCLTKIPSPPPVVVLASLPRAGGALLKTALEFATGVRVAQASEGQCNQRMHGFVETTYPFKRSSVPNNCAFWFNKYIRRKPNMVNVWGVVVIVRSPYRWIDDFFQNQPATSTMRNESDWDPFINRYSNMWRAFVEHWLLDESSEQNPLWTSRLGGVNLRQFTEGPIDLIDHNEEEEEEEQSFQKKRIQYYLVKYESLVKQPREIALKIVDWSKEAFAVNNPKSQQKLLERAEKCTNFGNVVGRMAKSHQEPPIGLGPRFKISETEPSNSSQFQRRKVVFDHTIPYLCALGHQAPKELSC